MFKQEKIYKQTSEKYVSIATARGEKRRGHPVRVHSVWAYHDQPLECTSCGGRVVVPKRFSLRFGEKK